jgi:hypothetical protein
VRVILLVVGLLAGSGGLPIFAERGTRVATVTLSFGDKGGVPAKIRCRARTTTSPHRRLRPVSPAPLCPETG